MARAVKKGKPELSLEEKQAQALIPEEEWTYRVPENWCWTKIGMLSTLHRGVTYKKNDAHSVKREDDCLIMRGGNIGEGYINLDADNVYVNKALVNTDQLIKANDIVIVASTGSTKVIGRAGISNTDYKDVAFGAFLMLVRPNAKANPKYIDYYFNSDLYRNRIRNLASGVNINNVRAEYITESPLPLPPLAEQQRIVDCIESLFAKLDEAKEKAEAVVEEMNVSIAQIRRCAYNGTLTANWRKANGEEDESWDKDELKEHLSLITYGFTNPMPDAEDGPWKITAKNVQNGYIDYTSSRKTTAEAFEMELTDKSRPIVGDVLLTKDGSIGRAAVVDREGICINQSVALLRTKDNLDPLFLQELLLSPEYQRIMESQAGGSAMKHIYITRIDKMKIPVPSKDEQKEVLRLLLPIIQRLQDARELAKSTCDAVDVMKKLILTRAFRGELGTNDPSDESAEKLLMQILQES